MAHVYDLASNWPADTVIMISQGWHAIPEGDGGADQDYGQWDLDSAAWHASDPVAYPKMPYDLQDASTCNGGHRFVASQMRPLTGIYSDSGRDSKSLAKIDRDLGMLRRAGDPRARVDVLATTVVHLALTSFNGYAEGDANYKRGQDNRYLCFAATLARAEAAGLTNCITVNYEAYPIWQFLGDIYPTTTEKKNAVLYDIANFAALLDASSAAFKVDGRPVLLWYRGTLGETITNGEWSTIMESARTASGVDFFVVGLDASGFQLGWMDGAFPWISRDDYEAAAGSTVEAKAENWAQDALTEIAANVADTGTYPGRIALANFTPGFWDYAKGFGSGEDRYIPRGSALISGQFTGYGELAARPDGIVCVTWNDYAEGTVIEPTTEDNAETIGLLTEAIGAYVGDSVSADDTAALKAIWQDAPKDITCPIQQTQPGPHVRKARRITPRGPA